MLSRLVALSLVLLLCVAFGSETSEPASTGPAPSQATAPGPVPAGQ